MNNIKLLKAQSTLALKMVDSRTRPVIEKYISALETEHEKMKAYAESQTLKLWRLQNKYTRDVITSFVLAALCVITALVAFWVMR